MAGGAEWLPAFLSTAHLGFVGVNGLAGGLFCTHKGSELTRARIRIGP